MKKIRKGQRFWVRGTEYAVVKLVASRPRWPVVVRRIRDSKIFKARIDMVTSGRRSASGYTRLGVRHPKKRIYGGRYRNVARAKTKGQRVLARGLRRFKASSLETIRLSNVILKGFKAGIEAGKKANCKRSAFGWASINLPTKSPATKVLMGIIGRHPNSPIGAGYTQRGIHRFSCRFGRCLNAEERFAEAFCDVLKKHGIDAYTTTTLD